MSLRFQMGRSEVSPLIRVHVNMLSLPWCTTWYPCLGHPQSLPPWCLRADTPTWSEPTTGKSNSELVSIIRKTGRNWKDFSRQPFSMYALQMLVSWLISHWLSSTGHTKLTWLDDSQQDQMAGMVGVYLRMHWVLVIFVTLLSCSEVTVWFSVCM